MAKNTNLHTAKKAKNDEFYTIYEDIEKECIHYKKYFTDKIVYCNCDDYEQSNFVKYFTDNFQNFGLKKLIATCFIKDGKGKYFEFNGRNTTVKELEGNGDFRSPECIELLKESDIVVTNPPFSLFREYVAQLVEYGKQFLIIGNQNVINNKGMFPLIKENKVWLGLTMNGSNRWFQAPSHYQVNEKASNYKEENGKKYFFVNGVVWFTNMEHDRRKQPLDLYMKYSNEYYKKYDNYDAIEVSKVCDIPINFEGVMGVPITFLHKYCPEQFEIVGLGIANLGLSIGVKPYEEEHKIYRKEIQKRGVVNGDLYMIENGIVKVPYARILIRHKR